MPTLETRVPHRLSQQKAMACVGEWLEQLKRERQDVVSDMEVTWDSALAEFHMRYQGLKVTGVLSATQTEINAEVEIPLMAWPFKAKVKEFIEDTLGRELEARAGISRD